MSFMVLQTGRRTFGCVRRVTGVALLAVRAALRSKAVIAMLAVLVAGSMLLPTVVKGDGTPEGYLQILLSYTLGFSFAILCLTTMWAACALFAAEIDRSLLQMSVVKPVRPFDLWLGKWCALLILDVFCLAAAYGVAYAQVRWRIARDAWDELERPTCRHVTRPVLPPPEVEAREVYEELRSHNALPKNMSEQAVLRVLRSAPQTNMT